MRFCFIVFLSCCLSSASAQTRDLSFFLGSAREHYTVLRDYQDQLLTLSLDSQLLKASLRTQVNALSTNSYAPIIKGYGYDEAITNIANVSAIVQASRNFMTRNNVASQYRTIAIQRQALLDTMALSGRDLLRTVTDQYITAYSDLLEADFNREIFSLMQKEEAALKKLTEASVYKQTDYLSFYVTMQQQELTYLQAEMQYQSDFLTLNSMAGIIDTTVMRIAAPSLAAGDTTGFYNSVFYKRFETDSMRIANEKAIIDYSYRPKIGAYTDAGYTSSLQFKPYRNFGFSAGVSLSIPLYDGNQKKMKYARLDIQERARTRNRTYYLNQYRQQIAQLSRQLESIDAIVGKINNQINFSRTLITANGKLLETGDITMKDYIGAINNFLNAQHMLVLNTISRLRIVNQINYWNQ